MILFFGILILLTISIAAFVRSPRFGSIASGARMERIKRSPNYREGAFQNLNVTPDLTEGASMPTVMRDFLFNKSKRASPVKELPNSRIDLHQLLPQENVLVWFGHSSYFLQVDGKKFLIDPVLSGNASPFSFTTKSFKGSDVYTAEDFPAIDYLLLSHDHWDHLDHRTIVKLKPKIKKVITGLGTGAHLEHWGFQPSCIKEMDWNEEEQLESGFTIFSTSARHFSGRGFKRNQSLWMSFVLRAPSMQIFIGGDSGYDSHFKDIGRKFGPFDLAILECGQYNKNWKYIHMMPEEVVMAAEDLKAKMLLPVHWGKFRLALHDWDDPINRVVKESEARHMAVIHPRIGEKVKLNVMSVFERWWEA